MARAWIALALLGCGAGEAVVKDAGALGGETGLTVDDPTEPGPTDTEDTDPTGTEEAPDYREAGPYGVREGDGSVQASCTLRYDSWWPEGTPPSALVVVAHGFARDKAQVAGHAAHWASWGLAVVAPSLCHASFLDTDHALNAEDLVALAAEVSGGVPVLYAGHSAGGLAALLATAQDASAVAHLGLDTTDSEGLALDAAPGIAVPAYAVLGEPEVCNEQGNAVDVYALAPEGRAVRVDGADHCDFEDPTDWVCTSFCGDGSGDDERVRGIVRGMSTAFLLWQSGVDPLGAQWWTDGTSWDALLEGAVTEL